LNEWAEGVHERLKKRLQKDAVTCWVEADTTTQRGQKHVLASIVHYFDQKKKKMRQWCYDIAEYVGPSLTAEVMYPYMVTAADKVGFTPAGFTSDSASDMSKLGRKLLADSWGPEKRKYLKWLPLWVPCCLHQFSLILGAGLNCDKLFLKQIMAEVARQHNTYGFVSYMREQAETARTKRVEQFMQALIAKAETDRGSSFDDEERKAFRKTNELYAILMVDKEIEKVRAEFEAEVLASGGTNSGLQVAWAKGAGGVNASNWRSEKHFGLHAVEYLNDREFVESLRGGRRFETASRGKTVICAHVVLQENHHQTGGMGRTWDVRGTYKRTSHSWDVRGTYVGRTWDVRGTCA
jgi:hypothetical protein